MRTSLSITLAAAVLAAPLSSPSAPVVAADEPTRITLTRWTTTRTSAAAPSRGSSSPEASSSWTDGRAAHPSRTSTPSATGRRAATRWAPGPRRSSSSRTPSTRRSRRGTRAPRRARGSRRSFRGRHPDGVVDQVVRAGSLDLGPRLRRGDIHRTSLDGQNDTDARILTDTFSTRSGREPVAFQTRVNLLRPVGASGAPRLDAVTTMTSELIPDYAGTSEFTLGRQVELAVPAYAQNIHSGEYPEFGGGGEVWCSPTSTAMVMRYFGSQHSPSAADLAGIVAPNGDPQVDHAALNVWDYTYEGAGNWPFNAAYARRTGSTRSSPGCGRWPRSSASSRRASRSSPRCRGTSRRCRRRGTTPTGTCW